VKHIFKKASVSSSNLAELSDNVNSRNVNC